MKDTIRHVVLSSLIATFLMTWSSGTHGSDGSEDESVGETMVQLPWSVSLGVGGEHQSHRHVCTGSLATITGVTGHWAGKLALTTAECAKRIEPFVMNGTAHAILEGVSVQIILAVPQPGYIGMEEMLRLAGNSLVGLLDFGFVVLDPQILDRQMIVPLEQARVPNNAFTGHWRVYGERHSPVRKEAEILSKAACQSQLNQADLRYVLYASNLNFDMILCVRGRAAKPGTPLYFWDSRTRQHRLLGMFTYSMGNSLSAYINVNLEMHKEKITALAATVVN